MSNVIKEFGPREAAGTAQFCGLINNFFDCLNVRVPIAVELVEEGRIVNKTRNLFEPCKRVDDFRFTWLKKDFLQ